ncbi:MAG: gliding motility-associated C-terminal domain-containing protein [Bacteroidales bacterium]|nr:gliding motility-associated C-terminal domain-containing protein [Bacteroidales bacterium]
MASKKKILQLIIFNFFISNFLIGQNCTVNADIDKDLCQNETMQLQGGENGLIDIHAVWSQIGGPSVNISNPNNLNSSVLGYLPDQTYTFRITATCLDGKTVHDDVEFTVKPISQANAGEDIQSCPTTLSLLANQITDIEETGSWSIIDNRGGINILNINSPSSSVTLSQTNAGVSILRWTITNSNLCTSFDEINITNYGGVNPISAGADQTLSQCYTSTQTTNLIASFGGANYGGQQGTWSMVSGPSYAVIGDIHDNTTTASGLIEGIYIFRWQVTGPCVNGSDEVIITVPAATQDVTNVINFPNQTYCYPESNIVLEGTVTEFADEVGYWTQITGYTANITNPNSATTSVSDLDGTHTYRFRYIIENTVTGCASGTDDVLIYYRAKPTIDASLADPNLTCGTTSASINVAYSSGSASRYKIVSGPYTTAWNNAPNPTNVTFAESGIYNLQFESYINGIGCTSDFDYLTISVSDSPLASNAGTDQILSCNVVETELEGNMPAIGNGFWSQVEGPSLVPDAIIENANDPHSRISGLEVGKYTFRWVISAGNNCPTTQDEVDVIVSKTTASSAAGDSKSVCHSSAITLSGNTPKDNEIGIWTVNPSIGINFANANDPSTIVTGMAANTPYTFTWTVINGCGPVSDDVVITTTNVQGPSLAYAGPDQCTNSGTISIGMDGNVPAIGTGIWTILSGPGSPIIVNPTLNNTTINNIVDGDYTIQWSINVPTCDATKDTLQVTIRNAVTNSLAGTDQSICGDEIIMSANSVNIGETGTWIQVSGNSGYTISSANSPTALFSNLTAGRYEFQWLIEKGICPSSSDNLVLTVSNEPSDANAGNDIVICNDTQATLSANNPISGTGTWSIIDSPNSPSIASFTSPTTTVTGLTSGEYTFRWTIITGTDCAAKEDDVLVQVSAPANAGSDIQLCDATSTILEGTNGTNGTWILVSGSPIPTISNNAYHTAMVYGMGLDQVYEFNYSLPEIYGCTGPFEDNVIVTTTPYGTEPDAGADQEICTSNGTSITMNANEPGVGTGTWNFVSGPSNPTIENNTFNSLVSNLNTEGVYIFEWNIDYGYCGNYKDVMRVNVYNPPTISDAGADQNNACQLNAQLDGNLPTIGIGIWTLISSPAGNSATISINNPNTNNTTISNPSHIGTYTFRWTIINGNVCSESTDDVDITFTDIPPSTPDADIDRDLCDVTSITMSGNNPVVGTGTWSQISGPNSAGIVSPNDFNTDIIGMIPGTYEFNWEIQNGGCTLNDEIIVVNSPTPSDPNAGNNQYLCRYESPVLTAEIPTYGSGEWSFVSGTTSANILNPNNTTTNVTGTDVGTYTFRWTVSSGTCADKTDDIIVDIVDFPAANLAVSDDEICDGADGSINIISSENNVVYEIYDGITLLETRTGDGNDIYFTISDLNLDIGNNYFSYTATNTSNCTVNFDNQSLIVVNPNPDIPLAVSDDIVCEGTDATLTISNSESGVNYEAFNGVTSIGTGLGNGIDLDITFPTDGTWIGANTITITATSAGTGCISNLSDQSSITVNANPLTDKIVYGSTVCIGSNASIIIANSELGIDYEAFIGATSVGAGSGSGGDLDINISSVDIPIVNSYTIDIVATSSTAPTNCAVPLSNQATVEVINPPLTNQVVSGNTVCKGNDATISIFSTENGVLYDIYYGAIFIGSGIGDGGNIDISCETSALIVGNNVISITASNSACAQTLDNTAIININEIPNSSLAVSDYTTCDESNATILIQSSENSINYEAFLNSISVWTGIGNGNDLEITIDADELSTGNNIIEIVGDNGNCSISLSDLANVIINENPNSELLVEGGTFCTNISANVTIKSSENNTIYTLFLNDDLLASDNGNTNDLQILINTDLLEVGENEIKVIATNIITSCMSELNNTAKVTIEECDIIVYDGFSPNGDGINDYFIIEGLDKRPNHKVTIINRWGNKVYEASPYLNDWEGTNMFGVSLGSDKLPVGTYFYIIDPGNGDPVKKGYIYLDY